MFKNFSDYFKHIVSLPVQRRLYLIGQESFQSSCLQKATAKIRSPLEGT